MRTAAPLFLAQPSRFAGWPRQRAVAALAVLAVLLLTSLLALGIPDAVHALGVSPSDPDEQTDLILYGSIVDGIRHGGNYYLVAADALRSGDYPLRPFVTFRLPTLAMVQAILPPAVITGLLYTLAAGVVIAWLIRLRPLFARPIPHMVAMLLLLGGLIAFTQSDLALFHEIWAGLLIAFSLAARRPGRWIESVALGLMAMLIRETAALYVGVMFVLALFDGSRREAAGWFGATAVLAVAVALHASAVADVVRPFDAASPGWAGMLGFGLFVKAMTLSTALTLLPSALAALLTALALFGWAACRGGFALRACTTLCAYAVLIGVFGRADAFYCGLLVAPLLLVGLAFVPDAIRDLTRAALDRRRITVTRTAS